MAIVDGALTLRETQMVSLEILKAVDEICREEGLRYYLAYGTLIGAIRHHGFIPWDDDLDIAMPRPDYNRLLSYFDAHSHNLLPLVALHNTQSRKLPFLMTRISNTAYREIGEYSSDVPEMGAFIDIYPLDGLGDDKDAARLEKRKCYRAIRMYLRAANFEYVRHAGGPFKRFAKRLVAAALGNPARYEARVMRGAGEKEYESSRYVSCKCWTTNAIMDMVHPKEDIGDGIPACFEGMEVPVPVNYDAVLRRQYGDYMQLPPAEERVGHHHYSIVKREIDDKLAL